MKQLEHSLDRVVTRSSFTLPKLLRLAVADPPCTPSGAEGEEASPPMASLLWRRKQVEEVPVAFTLETLRCGGRACVGCVSR